MFSDIIRKQKRMYLGRYIIGIVLLAICSMRVPGQSESNPPFTPQVFPNAPNSASLGKFGDYPVSYFSGLPQISIPVYQIEAGSIKVPISIDYHASGIKITDAASWVGLGWALSAGGEITRRMMGAREDENSGFLSGIMRVSTDINPYTEDGQLYLAQLTEVNDIDGEPDIFSYSFPGKSGKFFFDRTNSYQPALIPYAPISIKYTAGTNMTFTITDEAGNIYLYGSNVEITQTSTLGIATTVKTAWMLDKIISADKRDTVSFLYTGQSGQTYHDVLDTWVVDDHVTSGATTEQYPAPVYTANSVASLTIGEVYSYTSEKTLQEIDYKNGKVVFDLSASARQDISGYKSLADIKIYSYDYTVKQYQLLKTVVPFQSYFEQGTDASTKRLRFDSLQIKDKSGSVIERYRFDYNSLMLPNTTSRQRDYWGFYNGKANDYLIPRQQIDYITALNGGDGNPVWIGSSIANGREADTLYNQACMLKRIYFPTGGYTDFKYETNRYRDGSNNIKLSGGLRIRSISSYDGTGAAPVVRTYQYDAARANYILSNYYFNTEQTYRYWIPVGPSGAINSTKRVRTYLSNPTIDIIPFDATPVVYPVVTEYQGDSLNNTGKTVYTFTDYPDVLTTASGVRPVLTSYFYRRGQLESKTVYRNNGLPVYQPLHKEAYTFAAFPETIYGPAGLVGKDVIVEDGPAGPPELADKAQDWMFSNYSLTADDNYPTAETITDYDQNDSSKYSIQVITYSYGNLRHQQVTKTTTVDSKGDTLIQVKKYPADYIPVGGTNTGNAVLDSMLLHNMQASLIEQWDSVKTSTSVSGVKHAQITVYKQLSPGILKPDNTRQLEITAPISDFIPGHVTSGQLQFDSRYIPAITLSAYDNAANIKEYRARNASPVSIIWDYGNHLPVANVTASGNQDAAYTSFEADGKGGWTFTGTPVVNSTAPTGGMVYNMQTGGISKTGLTNGTVYIISYWSTSGAYTITGGSGSSKTGKTVNGWTYYEHTITASGTTLSISQTTGAAYIDELRLYPSTAQMTTYTYAPLIGITSQCDVDNRITYYFYDSFGRLRWIKDQDGNIVKTIQYHYVKQTGF